MDISEATVNFFGIVMGVQTYIDSLQWAVIIGLLVFGFFWFAAGPWMSAYAMARLTNRKVAIEYDKTREFKPFAIQIPKDFKAVFKLPGNRGVVGIRRDSIGHSNKIQTMLFASEFEYTVSPREITGERYFMTTNKNVKWGYFNDQGEFIETERPSSILDRFNNIGPQDPSKPEIQMWVKYPISTVTPEEFVKFQQINGDPMLTEGYAQHKENALREKIYNPMAAFVAQYGWFLIPLIIVGALAYSWIAQNNQAAGAIADLDQCKSHIIDMYNAGVCKGNMPFNLTQGINTGGAVQ